MLKFSALCALLAFLVYNAEAHPFTLSSVGPSMGGGMMGLMDDSAEPASLASLGGGGMMMEFGDSAEEPASLTSLSKEYKSKLFSFKKTKLELDIIQAKYALATLRQKGNVIMEDPQRPKGFGMTAVLARKRAKGFDAELASDAMRWIKEVLLWGKNDMASKVTTEISSTDDIKNLLKDGTILCAFINTIKPGSVKKIYKGTKNTKQMENIGNFLQAAGGFVPHLDLFRTTDLYLGANIPQVVKGIIALGRNVLIKRLVGPILRPKESTANKRKFTEEQLRAGEGVIGLHAGSNKGASQSGQNFGKKRAIIDDTANYDNDGLF